MCTPTVFYARGREHPTYPPLCAAFSRYVVNYAVYAIHTNVVYQIFCLHGGLSPSIETLDHIRALDRVQEVSIVVCIAGFGPIHVPVVYSCLGTSTKHHELAVLARRVLLLSRRLFWPPRLICRNCALISALHS